MTVILRVRFAGREVRRAQRRPGCAPALGAGIGNARRALFGFRAAERLRTPDMSGRVRVIPPAGYLDFIALQASARLVLTDSGGVQEETTVLGIPCLTLRDNTERPVTVTEGTNRAVGRDPGRIVAAAREAIESPPRRRAPVLWDGHAGDRIAAALVAGGGAAGHPRPTDQPRASAGISG